MVRLIGRREDLDGHAPTVGQQRLEDALARWSIDGNAAWIDQGVARAEPFLQLSPDALGTVLHWELERLRAAGYVAVGPYWVPADWRCDGESYRRVVRLCAEWALARPRGEDVYVSKALAELEPLLALWPHVLALPTTAALSLDDLILGRAWPVHPLGMASAAQWGDGRLCSPAEFFCHDLDHARFKVREDLLADGFDVPDAYVDGSTFDPASRSHRRILPAMQGMVGSALWGKGPARTSLARRLLVAIAAEPERALGEAARWLLFELLHEKSLPLDAAVLRAGLGHELHVHKLLAKCRRGFFATAAPAAPVQVRIAAARPWLLQRLGEVAG